MNVQSCFMSTFISINIARLFRQSNPQNAKIIISIKLCKKKKEIIFVYLSNTSHFMHFQSVRKKKGNIHDKTNKYRWHFRSKPHQTTSLSRLWRNSQSVNSHQRPCLSNVWSCDVALFSMGMHSENVLCHVTGSTLFCCFLPYTSLQHLRNQDNIH